MGDARFSTLGDFAKREANVGAVCGSCGRRGVVHRDVLARWCFLKRVNSVVDNLPRAA
jgi:hypothetical protein